MKWFWIIVAVIVIVLGITLASSGTSDTDTVMEGADTMMEEETSMMEEKGDMSNSGQYIPYSPDKLALAETGKVVLFFRAPWCPTCRALDRDIRANLDDIPEGVVILDTDYDSSTALKQKYGVTYQHTLVQVDATGNQVAKWTGSDTLSELLSNIK